MIAIIRIDIEGNIKTNLALRYTLIDTINSRQIGIILTEGSSSGKMEIVVEIKNKIKFDGEVKSLLKSLGLLQNGTIVYT